MRSVALLTERGRTPLSPEGLAEIFLAGGVEVAAFDISPWREPLELQLGDWWDRGVLETDRIVVAGGDETISLAGRVAAEAGLPLAVIPGGHSNVFASQMGLPLDIGESAALAVGTTTRPTRIATAGHHPFAHHASLLARWVIRRKPFPSRVWFDGEEVHDDGTLAIQVLPPPAEDPAGELVAKLTGADGEGMAERRCSVVEAHVPLDRMLDIDGVEVPAVTLADGAIIRFALSEPFELVVAA